MNRSQAFKRFGMVEADYSPISIDHELSVEFVSFLRFYKGGGSPPPPPPIPPPPSPVDNMPIMEAMDRERKRLKGVGRKSTILGGGLGSSDDKLGGNSILGK